jgi:hypothetical protein
LFLSIASFSKFSRNQFNSYIRNFSSATAPRHSNDYRFIFLIAITFILAPASRKKILFAFRAFGHFYSGTIGDAAMLGDRLAQTWKGCGPVAREHSPIRFIRDVIGPY